MLQFHCKNCSQKISVPEVHAGKKGKCPKCGHLLVVPGPKNVSSGDMRIKRPAADPKPDFLSPLGELRLKEEPPPQTNIPDTVPADDSNVFSKLRQIIGAAETGKPPARRLPLILDILLYPASTSGVINMAVFWLLSVLFMVTRIVPMVLFYARFIAGGIVAAYMYYYLMECIRDSAAGGIKAPDNIKSMPDSISDAVSQALEALASVVIFWGPVIAYFIYKIFSRPVGAVAYNPRADTILWLLLGYGIFFFPMGLLAITMFNSSSGYNPFLWLASIFSTFFQYCKLILLFCLFGWLVSTVPSLFPQLMPFLFLFRSVVFMYLGMIAAHLLGRFYYLNSEKLNWDV